MYWLQLYYSIVPGALAVVTACFSLLFGIFILPNINAKSAALSFQSNALKPVLSININSWKILSIPYASLHIRPQEQ